MPKVLSGIRQTAEEKREKDRQYQQKKRKNQGETLPKKTDEKEKKKTVFIGIDGEGRNDPTRDYYYDDENGSCYRIADRKRVARSEYQAYTLLQSSSGEYIENRDGLSTYDCLYFLCTLGLQYPNAQFVGYGLSYDINMWLRDMSYCDHKYLRDWMEKEHSQRKDEFEIPPTTGFIYYDVDPPHCESPLRKENKTDVTFLIEWLQRKELKITCVEVDDENGEFKYETYLQKKRETGEKIEKRRRLQHGTFQIFDVLGFFGSKFMDALKDMNILEGEEDQLFLQNMKNAREQFNLYSMEKIREYCLKECVYLVKLMEKVEFYCHELGLDMKRWDGAGAIAAAMMKKYHIEEHIQSLEGGILEAARHAFSGGRIELVRYGHIAGKEMTYAQTLPYIEKKYNMQIKDATVKLKHLEKKEIVNKVVGDIMTNYYKIFFIRDGKRYNEKEAKEYVKENGGEMQDHFEHMTAEIVVWDYDVNSAYPTCIKDLPSLKGGVWKLENEIKTQLACCHVRWSLLEKDDKDPVRIFPFFYRKESGMIIYPEQGENWVWLPEYEAYLKHADKYAGSVELVEVYNFYPANDIKPFAFVDELAKKRLGWKELYKKTNGQEGGQHIIAKLGLNSLYGKTAQQIGWHMKENGDIVLPPFHNLAWAGYITSFCRAKVYDAAMHNPQAVVMFATDGLFVTEPIDHLTLSADLGDWEKTTVTKFTALQSGVYFSDSGSKQSSKTRGFEAGSITEDMVLDAWNKGIPGSEIDVKTGEPKMRPWIVTGNTHKFITIGSLLSSHRLWDKDELECVSPPARKTKMKMLNKKNKYRFCCWEDIPREQSLSPVNTKREMDDDQNPFNHPKWNAAKMLLPTIPASDEKWRYGDISKKYELLWVIDPKYMTEFEKNEKQQSEDYEDFKEQ